MHCANGNMCAAILTLEIQYQQGRAPAGKDGHYCFAVALRRRSLSRATIDRSALPCIAVPLYFSALASLITTAVPQPTLPSARTIVVFIVAAPGWDAYPSRTRGHDMSKKETT